MPSEHEYRLCLSLSLSAGTESGLTLFTTSG